ncbi:MAG: 2-dehydropantoate 2-reductase [Parasporobacterium sp.]|nr:2-dehydropantoate 2-reductase [Parasporobacterium sp.]
MINNIAVIGAGAVGSFFLTGLSGKDNTHIWAVASSERGRRLKQDGICINGTRLIPEVRTPEGSKGADLVIICVKYGALQGVLDDLQVIADDHTIFLCPMNGVDSEEIIAGRLGKGHILHSMMVIAAERTGNAVRYNDGVIPCIHYGLADGFGSKEDLEEVTELFRRTGLTCKYKEEIITAIWNKFALNISTNIAQAIIGTNYGSYKTSPHMNALGQKLCDEVLAVAEAAGITCTFDNQRALKTLGTNNAARFSTLQDLLAGRHTEVDMFCGAVVRLGREYQVPTPFNEFAWHAIKALEEKNDGLIF